MVFNTANCHARSHAPKQPWWDDQLLPIRGPQNLANGLVDVGGRCHGRALCILPRLSLAHATSGAVYSPGAIPSWADSAPAGIARPSVSARRLAVEDAVAVRA